MSKLPRIIAIVLVVAGVVMIGAGAATYYLVHRELADEHITVSDDARAFAGKDVAGPFTAYSEATTIKVHASEIADGKTYAQLDRDDPRRDQVMTASFLRASLFTSVVAFGVAALVVGLGVLFVGVGIALLALDARIGRAAPDAAEPPPVVAAA
ncbi:MAG: aromatic ring-opening dioxygenase LigA [Ilumatobacteraceae bacterium]